MKKLLISNLTDAQHNWLKKESARRGLSMAALVKIWIQDKIEKK